MIRPPHQPALGQFAEQGAVFLFLDKLQKGLPLVVEAGVHRDAGRRHGRASPAGSPAA